MSHFQRGRPYITHLNFLQAEINDKHYKESNWCCRLQANCHWRPCSCFSPETLICRRIMTPLEPYRLPTPTTILQCLVLVRVATNSSCPYATQLTSRSAMPCRRRYAWEALDSVWHDERTRERRDPIT